MFAVKWRQMCLDLMGLFCITTMDGQLQVLQMDHVVPDIQGLVSLGWLKMLSRGLSIQLRQVMKFITIMEVITVLSLIIGTMMDCLMIIVPIRVCQSTAAIMLKKSRAVTVPQRETHLEEELASNFKAL